MGKSNKVCPNCGRKMKQQFIGLQHCKCGVSWKKDIGFLGELKEAMHSICAILNKHQHGELYYGVKPDGTPIGQVVIEESLREVGQCSS